MLDYQHVNVFATAPYHGNSLPVFLNTDSLTIRQMLQVTPSHSGRTIHPRWKEARTAMTIVAHAHPYVIGVDTHARTGGRQPVTSARKSMISRMTSTVVMRTRPVHLLPIGLSTLGLALEGSGERSTERACNQ